MIDLQQEDWQAQRRWRENRDRRIAEHQAEQERLHEADLCNVPKYLPVDDDEFPDESYTAGWREEERCWCDWAPSEGMTHDDWILANDYPDHEPAPEWNIPEPVDEDSFGWDDGASSTADDLDDQAEDDPDSEFALVNNGWLARLVRD